MSWFTVALLGSIAGAWLKRYVWKHSHNGIRGWFNRRAYTFKQWRKRRRLLRALEKNRVVR